MPVVEAGPPVVLVGWPAGGFTPVPMVLPPVAGLAGVVVAGRVGVVAGGRPACAQTTVEAAAKRAVNPRIFTLDYRRFFVNARGLRA